MTLKPPDDRATILAKETLVQIKDIEELAKFCGKDPTQAQEFTISIALRNYFIEKTEYKAAIAAEEQES